MKKIWIASLVVAAVTVPATLPRTAVAQPADLADPDLAAVAESVRAEADTPALALAVIQPDGELLGELMRGARPSRASSGDGRGRL